MEELAEDLTERQRARLAEIARTSRRLTAPTCCKSSCGSCFTIALLDQQLEWASRSKLPAFVKLARTIREHKNRIHAALIHDLSNARVESMNTRLRLIMRSASGVRSVEALIGLAMLAHGGLCPPLPAALHDPRIVEKTPFL